MRRKEYDIFVFDLYGTLADIRTNEDKPGLWRKMSEMYSSLGAHYSPTELKKNYLLICRRNAEQVQAEGVRSYGEEFLGEPDLTAVFQDLFRQKGISCSRERAADFAGFFRILSREKLKLYEGVKETLKKMRGAGKRVYLLSNAQGDFTRPEIELLGLKDCFDGILISSEEGCRKPSPVFYRRLIVRYGLSPKNCLMMGNDMNTDIKGAKAVGMDTLYIHTESSPQLTGKPEADYVVLDGNWHKAVEILMEVAGLCRLQSYYRE